MSRKKAVTKFVLLKQLVYIYNKLHIFQPIIILNIHPSTGLFEVRTFGLIL